MQICWRSRHDIEASGGAVSYNYGVAIGAWSEESNGSLAKLTATYLIENVHSATVNGYNILPDYRHSGNGFGVFNGIALRWMAIGNGHGLMPSNFVPWAQENISLWLELPRFAGTGLGRLDSRPSCRQFSADPKQWTVWRRLHSHAGRNVHGSSAVFIGSREMPQATHGNARVIHARIVTTF